MKLNNLPREKRKQLLVVSLVTLVALAGLGFGVIQFQYAKIKHLQALQKASSARLSSMQDTVKRGAALEPELPTLANNLSLLESDVSSGDTYAWLIQKVRQLRGFHKVELSSFSPIGPSLDVNLIPRFPYKQASLFVVGKAYYHDFGRFLADFENQFPHLRIVNLTLDLDPAPQEPEKLSFKMEIVTLLKKS